MKLLIIFALVGLLIISGCNSNNQDNRPSIIIEQTSSIEQTNNQIKLDREICDKFSDIKYLGYIKNNTFGGMSEDYDDFVNLEYKETASNIVICGVNTIYCYENTCKFYRPQVIFEITHTEADYFQFYDMMGDFIYPTIQGKPISFIAKSTDRYFASRIEDTRYGIEHCAELFYKEYKWNGNDIGRFDARYKCNIKKIKEYPSEVEESIKLYNGTIYKYKTPVITSEYVIETGYIPKSED